MGIWLHCKGNFSNSPHVAKLLQSSTDMHCLSKYANWWRTVCNYFCCHHVTAKYSDKFVLFLIIDGHFYVDKGIFIIKHYGANPSNGDDDYLSPPSTRIPVATLLCPSPQGPSRSPIPLSIRGHTHALSPSPALRPLSLRDSRRQPSLSPSLLNRTLSGHFPQGVLMNL